ncbi:MAG: hypothetical protein ACI9LY_003315 [Arenicella sp.]|jgi:outer membrane biogenesis lipoprotein LolB
MMLRKFAICTFAIAMLSACGDSTPESPETSVKHTLERIEQAAEKRSLADFMLRQ